jgi:hypothetical protein
LENHGWLAVKIEEVGFPNGDLTASDGNFFQFSGFFSWSEIFPDRPGCQSGEGYAYRSHDDKEEIPPLCGGNRLIFHDFPF